MTNNEKNELDQSYVPKLIKAGRKRAGLTQQIIAEWLRMDRSNYSKKETGKVPLKFKEIVDILDLLERHLLPGVLEDLRYRIMRARTKGQKKNEHLIKYQGCKFSDYPQIQRYINIICDAAENDDISFAYQAMKKTIMLIELEVPSGISNEEGNEMIYPGFKDM
jgi:hypothetical protein